MRKFFGTTKVLLDQNGFKSADSLAGFQLITAESNALGLLAAWLFKGPEVDFEMEGSPRSPLSASSGSH